MQVFTRLGTSNNILERALKIPGGAYFCATTTNGDALGWVPSAMWQLVHASLLPTKGRPLAARMPLSTPRYLYVEWISSLPLAAEEDIVAGSGSR